MQNKKCLMLVHFLWLGISSFSQTRNLDYYIDRALANSPLIKDYRNQVQSNNADILLTQATYKTQVTGTSNEYYAPVLHGFGYDGAITNGGNITALAGASKTFVSRSYLNHQLETIRLQSRGIENTAKISEQDLKESITDQYIRAYGDLLQLNFSGEIYTLLKKEDTILKKLTTQNVYRQTDYLTFMVTLQQQELAMKQFSVQYRNDCAALNYLSGEEDTTIGILPDPGITLNYAAQPENSVFFQQYTIDSLQLRNERAIIDAMYKPKLSLFADAGYNSTLVFKPYKNFGTSIGGSLTVPIYDGRQRKLKYSKLTIAERIRAGYKDFFSHQYNQQIAQYTRQLAATDELIVQISNQIKYAETLITVNLKLLQTGDTRIADLVIALNNYLLAKNLLTQNSISHLQIINQINYWNR